MELKKDHETARKEMEKKQIGTAINFLSDLIEEWDTIIYRYIFTVCMHRLKTNRSESTVKLGNKELFGHPKIVP